VDPSHARLPSNELADSLAKTGAIFSFAHVPSSLAPVIAKITHTRGDEIFLTTPSSTGFLRCELSDFTATVTAFSCPLTYAG